MNSTETASLAPLTDPRPGAGRRRRLAPLREAPVWEPLSNGWRRLYGDFYERGVSVEWHEFEIEKPLDWSRSFHPDSLELCLNFSGRAWVDFGGTRSEFEPLSAGFYLPANGGLLASRHGSQRHRFLTVEFAARFLRQKLSAHDGALHPSVQHFIRGEVKRPEIGPVRLLTGEQERSLSQLPSPPVPQAARELWYESKVLDLMTAFFFEQRADDELFCDRQKRVARERVERVVGVLRERLAEPPNLAEIGRLVGCSPFYLSRTFSAETGMTIPQYLRRMRIERAAEFLRSGKYNVTEAALEVGYSSLSHFSQAFCQTMGCCPALYPARATNR
jgi:AraC-like DNA-binding protein